MKRHIAAWLTLTIVTAAQGAVEEPASSAKRREAAMKALAQGDAPGAERLHKENVAEAEKLGRDGLQLAGPLECLAVFYADSDRKRFDDALPLLRRALAIREQWQGCEDADVGETLNLLAMVLIMSKRDDPLIMPLLERARIVLENGRGKDDPSVADVLHTMALRQISSGEFATAEANLERAMAIREKAFGPFSNKLANIVDDLGDLHFRQIKLFEWLDLETEARKKPPGENDSEKHARLAHDFYARALAIREKIDKPDDDHIGDSLYNLGQLAWVRGRSEEMERYLTRWLDWDRAGKGRGEIKIRARVFLMLGGAAVERKDFDGADAWLAKAQAMIGDVNEKNSAEVSGLLSARAGIALEAKQFDEADAFFKEAISVQSEVSGKDSTEVAALLVERAEGALTAKRFDEADAFLKEALTHQAVLIGPDDPDLTSARELMAGRYQDQANDPRAPTRWREITAIAKAMADDHWELQTILNAYVKLLRASNTAVPKPTEADLHYLREIRATYSTDLDDFAQTRELISPRIDDEALSHMEGLALLESLSVCPTLDDPSTRKIGNGVEHLKGLMNLRELRLVASRITDVELVNLAGLKNLENLNLCRAPITDAGLTHLAKLTNLRELKLAHTDITDEGLKLLQAMENLRIVDFSGTRVTDTAAAQFRRDHPGLISLAHVTGSGYLDPDVIRSHFEKAHKSSPTSSKP